jgi:hypothetical protein
MAEQTKKMTESHETWACGVGRLGRGRVGSIGCGLDRGEQGQCGRMGQHGVRMAPSRVGELGDRSSTHGN